MIFSGSVPGSWYPGLQGEITILSWNCRGLDNLCAVLVLKCLSWLDDIFFNFFFFLFATFIQLNNVVANDWQIIDFFMQVAQKLMKYQLI
jgi:hypothetical protein